MNLVSNLLKNLRVFKNLKVFFCFSISLFFSVFIFAESVFKSSDQNLRLYEYESEQLACSNGFLGDGKNIVTVDQDSFAQLKFDSLCRIIERTEWSGGVTSSKNAKVVAKKTYYYNSSTDANNVIPYSTNEIRYDKNIATETFFDKVGNPTKTFFYTLNSGEKKLKQKKECTYSNNKIVTEKITETNSKLPTKLTKFTYTNKSSNPDTEYYEDGILRVQTVYEAENSYEVKTYFEKNYYVCVLYKEGERVLETIILNGKEQSRRKFNAD